MLSLKIYDAVLKSVTDLWTKSKDSDIITYNGYCVRGRNMTLLVLSDSHRKRSKITRAIELAGKFDALLFLGDGLGDIYGCDTDGAPLYCVAGNCDAFGPFDDSAPDRLILTLRGKKIFMTHGHRYGVKSGLDSLIYAAAEQDADILLFGHTHGAYEAYLTPETVPCLNKPLYVLNPGAISDGVWGCVDITLRGEIMLSHGTL